MIPNDTIPSVMNYANSCCALKAAPTSDQIRAGVIPLDSLPAAWWNCMWYDTNKAVNCTRYSLTSIIQEINSVLAAAGKQVDQCCVNQLYESIETIRQTIGNSICAGAVKSSSAGGEISIAANGVMTANGVGNAAYLTTSSHTIVNAINELKQTYTSCFSTLSPLLDTVDNIKANTEHAITGTAYGVGNAYDYGHLKISDTYDCCIGAAADGMAASQKAVSDMYNYYASMQSADKECACTAYHCYISPDCYNYSSVLYWVVSDVSGYSHPIPISTVYRGRTGDSTIHLGNVCCTSLISAYFCCQDRQFLNISVGSINYTGYMICAIKTISGCNLASYYTSPSSFALVCPYLFNCFFTQYSSYSAFRACEGWGTGVVCRCQCNALYGELPVTWNRCIGKTTCRTNYAGVMRFNFWNAIPLFALCTCVFGEDVPVNCYWDLFDSQVRVNNCTLIHCVDLYYWSCCNYEPGTKWLGYQVKDRNGIYGYGRPHVNFNWYILPFGCNCIIDCCRTAFLGYGSTGNCYSDPQTPTWYTPPSASFLEFGYPVYWYYSGEMCTCYPGDVGGYCVPSAWYYFSQGDTMLTWANSICPPYTWMECFKRCLNAGSATALNRATKGCFASQPPMYLVYVES